MTRKHINQIVLALLAAALAAFGMVATLAIK